MSAERPTQEIEPEVIHSPWVQETLNKLRLLEDRPGTPKREEKEWKLAAEVVSEFYERGFDAFPDHLEEQAAHIFDNSHQAKISAQVRGYFFENISRFTRLGKPKPESSAKNSLVVNHYPAETYIESFDDEGNFVFTNEQKELDIKLQDMTQKTVYELKRDRPSNEKLAWDKGALISMEIRNRLLAELRESNLENEVFVYVPALDDSYREYNAQLNAGKVVVRFDPTIREWATVAKVDGQTDSEGAQAKAAAKNMWADKANEINKDLSSGWTLPDSVIFEGDTPVGVIETKCWHTAELEALVSFLEEHEGKNLGGDISTEDIDIHRLVKAEQDTYGKNTESLNLILKLAEEVAFVQQSAGEPINSPLIVLRFPANISAVEIIDLQEQLYNRGYKNVLIQQILLSADEVEMIASEYLHSPKFVSQLESKYTDMKSGGGGKKYRHSEFKRNLKARALALKMTDASIREFVMPENPDELDHSRNRLKKEWVKQFR